ncbi:TetR/AcrR family transcriptional regulator [Micromonospora parathelypteridis]|uniref:AcrR family transcriptional regulator n=1 Tax=Micromonospora parathelypteridis TaxID=1839617 RepID=A0A840W1F5_9ACTN|nr:TetR/AcrR family transcriptional regulator [Micromonospora parathelypteridis]MBB5479904.1 AcrR family transcriptional regulator [Micromonospora parathelypteridis]GGO25979.1 TetR family transcriptional regulator [Micromonospora parathelypteridis]
MSRAPNAARRSESSRRAILTATAELCSEDGYGRLTIEAIATRAGVSKKTIYRWWPSKGAVVLELLDEAASVAVDPPDTGDLATDLRALLTEVIGLLTPPHNSPAIGLIAEALHDPDLARDLRERLIQPRIATFKERLRRAQETGQLPPDADLDVALDLLYGPLYHRMALHLGMPDSSHLDSLIAHVLRALTPPPSAGVPEQRRESQTGVS